MDIPNLDNLINAIQCEGCYKHKCEHCPYGYGYLDTTGDNSFWWCDEGKIMTDALFYLQIYQHLIKEKENETIY